MNEVKNKNMEYQSDDEPYNKNEKIYLDLLEQILEIGERRPNRTGIDTISVFGLKVVYNISETVPFLTTKKLMVKSMIKELLFIINGLTNTKLLEQWRVNYWKGNTSREFLDKHGLSNYTAGDMGPLYGYQWRHYGYKYEGCGKDLYDSLNKYEGKGIDQLEQVIKSIKEDPFGRRHVVTAWNPENISEMALPPCHMFFQFYVSVDKEYLDCLLYQRSCDMFLGVPFNIGSYSVLTYLIAHICGLKPRFFTHMMGDAHIYVDHIDAVNEQLKRTPYPHPVLEIDPSIKSLSDIKYDEDTLNKIKVKGYQSHPFIIAKMAI